jgi:hypothetical protein
VTGSVTAVIIAMGSGFRTVWLVALATYAAGVVAFILLAKAPDRATDKA